MSFKSRPVAVMAALLLLTSVVSAQDFARVKGNRVRVRGGPGDAHAILRQLDAGTPLEVKEKKGDWVRVGVPGGVVAYVSAGTASRPYVREDRPGIGVVRVSRLMVRGTPNTDHPPIGALEPGNAVELLALEGGWYRVLVADGAATWIHRTFVEDIPDDAAASATFAKAAAAERARLLEAAPLARAAKEKTAVETERRNFADSTFAAFREEQVKAPQERDPKALEQDLRQIVASAPEGNPDRVQAERMLVALDDWAELKKAFADLQKRKEELRKETTTRYTEELSKIRKKVETRAKEKGKPKPKSPYVATGWVRAPLPLQGVVDRQAGYRLERGGEREYILESDRYNLKDYVAGSFLIGIVEAEGPYRRPGLTLPVLHVKRLEILAPREGR